MSEYFPEPKSVGASVKVELELSNYKKKGISNNATWVDTLDLAKRTNLANLNSEVDKLDIDKLKDVPSGLSSLKSKADKLDIGKLETTPVYLSKISNAINKCR